MIRNWVEAVEMTSFDSSGMAAGYQVIDIAGLDYPCFLIRIINASSKDITLSYDGTTDQDYLVAGNTLQLSLQKNALPHGKVLQMKQGAKVYVKGTAGAGFIYLVGYFQ